MTARAARWLARAGATLCAGSIVTLAVAAIPLAPLDIAQRATRFSQSSLNVKTGETVRYHNFDDVLHNLMIIGADDEPKDQGLQRPGAVVSYKFTEAGTFEVRCAIHPKMKMTVTVAE